MATTLTAAIPAQERLARTERLAPEALLEKQLAQLAALVVHAYANVPFYRARLDAAGIVPGARIELDQWRRLALLTRREVQGSGTALHALRLPQREGRVLETSSSGSTGIPVTVLGTDREALVFKILSLRNHLWHRRDFARKIGVINSLSFPNARRREGFRQARWGDGEALPFETGPAAFLDISNPVARQIEWLEAERPAYLITYPSNLAAILAAYEAAGRGSPGVIEVISQGEVLPDEVREQCLRVWNATIQDGYSAQEVGVMALQCPDHLHYHVQSEAVLLELIDEDGKPVPEGGIGRVVVTPLYNHAMPLLRYEIGDYAQSGPPCPCGRTLPVLTRIMGRARNMLVTPDGNRYWPTIGSRRFREIAPVVQHQIVQTRPDRLEIRLVAERALTDDEIAKLERHIRGSLPYPFEIAIRPMAEIPRQPNSKFEYFRSEIAARVDGV